MVKVEKRCCLPAVSFGDVVVMGEEIADPETEICPPMILLVTAVATEEMVEVVGSPYGRRICTFAGRSCVPRREYLVLHVLRLLSHAHPLWQPVRQLCCKVGALQCDKTLAQGLAARILPSRFWRSSEWLVSHAANPFSDDFVHISQSAIRFAPTASIPTSRTWSNGRCDIEKHRRIERKLFAFVKQ